MAACLVGEVKLAGQKADFVCIIMPQGLPPQMGMKQMTLRPVSSKTKQKPVYQARGETSEKTDARYS